MSHLYLVLPCAWAGKPAGGIRRRELDAVGVEFVCRGRIDRELDLVPRQSSPLCGYFWMLTLDPTKNPAAATTRPTATIAPSVFAFVESPRYEPAPPDAAACRRNGNIPLRKLAALD